MTKIDLSGIADAAKKLSCLPTAAKRSVLVDLAARIEAEMPKLLAANAKDLEREAAMTGPLRERLTLNEKRIMDMIAGLRDLANWPDPVGAQIETSTKDSGIEISKIRWPMGTVMVIFESRPNIISEVFALGFYAGNAMILKGGKESADTSAFLYSLIKQSLAPHFPAAFPFFGDNLLSREDVKSLLQQKDQIQLLIPRGGDQLMRFCEEHSKIPMLKNDRGLCHLYVHEDADLRMAVDVTENAKSSRPSVCNSLETLLVNEKRAVEILPHIYATLAKSGTVWHCCPESFKILNPLSADHVVQATETSFDTEYLDHHLNCKIVSSLEDATAHIEKHSSRHSDAILTTSAESAKQFFLGVNSAAVYWNASTRFTDGGQFELGGEIGISTERVFHRGPIGLVDLTTPRFWVKGQGQTRK